MAAFEVNKESLGAAAVALSLLPREVNQTAALGSDPVAKNLQGSTVGTPLARAESAATVAKGVLTARFNEFAALLQLSADKFAGTDEDAAQRIAAVADLNSGTTDAWMFGPQPRK